MALSTPRSDYDFLAQYHERQLQDKIDELRKHRPLIEAFQVMCRSRGIHLTEENFDYIEKIGIVAIAPALVTKLEPALSRQRDNLYSLSELLERFSPDRSSAGYLRSPHYVLMAHTAYRRGFHRSNNFAPRFLEVFWEYPSESASRYLALDPDRVRIDADGPTCLEADTWFGAPFDADVARIPNGVAKLRPPMDIEQSLVSFFFADAYSLDIKWSQTEEIKTFQALELKSDRVTALLDGERYFPARYLHAEFDMRTNSFRHFDGAIQYYTQGEYLERRDTDFNHNAKHPAHLKARSEKLFKINGNIAVNDWVDLSCHFLTGDPLAFEYFTGRYPAHVDEALAKLRARV